jgi:5-methylcytosine-specific restriction endonuclease McrA
MVCGQCPPYGSTLSLLVSAPHIPFNIFASEVKNIILENGYAINKIQVHCSFQFCLNMTLSKENNFIVLTAEIFDLAVSSNGGFSSAQLSLFGTTFPPTKGWKKKMIGTLVSREVVEEFIALKDKHLTEDRRKNPSKIPSFIEVNHPITWKEQYKHPNWQRMRLYIFNRDNFTCQSCSNHHLLLHVHHTKYSQNKFIWETDPLTLVTLCEVCHSQKHNRDLTMQ